MKANKLSKRLSAIYDLVDEGSSLADIGADHGLLVIELYKNNKCRKLFCNDNKIGPYTILKNNVLSNNCDIEVSLSSGIEAVPSYINEVVIAGMGGELVVEILKHDINVLSHIDTLILEPNTSSEFVRREVTKLGYKIVDEKVVYEKHYYEIIKFARGIEDYNEDDYTFGPILRKKMSKEFVDMLRERKNKLENIIKKDVGSKRKQAIYAEIERIKKYEY